MRAAGSEQQRVAVGRRLRHGGCAEHAARAAAIFDDDRLAELFAQPRRDDAGGHIDAAAGDERHDDLHRLIGIVLRSRQAERRGCRAAKCSGQENKSTSGEDSSSSCCLCDVDLESAIYQLRDLGLAPDQRQTCFATCVERRSGAGGLIDQWNKSRTCNRTGPSRSILPRAARIASAD